MRHDIRVWGTFWGNEGITAEQLRYKLDSEQLSGWSDRRQHNSARQSVADETVTVRIHWVHLHSFKHLCWLSNDITSRYILPSCNRCYLVKWQFNDPILDSALASTGFQQALWWNGGDKWTHTRSAVKGVKGSLCQALSPHLVWSADCSMGYC